MKQATKRKPKAKQADLDGTSGNIPGCEYRPPRESGWLITFVGPEVWDAIKEPKPIIHSKPRRKPA
jgi:hypothetical protein